VHPVLWWRGSAWRRRFLIRNAQQPERLATIDPLTGLYNRRHFLTALETEWSRFQRYYRSVSVLMVDIDHFKNIDDRYVHAVGGNCGSSRSVSPGEAEIRRCRRCAR